MRRLTTPLTLAACVALLAGCGLFGGGGDDPPGPDPSSGQSSGGSGGGESEEPSGPSTEDLSAQILDAAEATDDATPIGTVTGVPTGADTELTIDVLSVQRVENGTVVLMRWSGTDGDNLSTSIFRDTVRGTQGFVSNTLYLVDPTVSRSRYLPLLFEDQNATNCNCPKPPMKFGYEPLLVSATYAPLPEGAQTVDLVLNEGTLTITGLPVTG